MDLGSMVDDAIFVDNIFHKLLDFYKEGKLSAWTLSVLYGILVHWFGKLDPHRIIHEVVVHPNSDIICLF